MILAPLYEPIKANDTIRFSRTGGVLEAAGGLCSVIAVGIGIILYINYQQNMLSLPVLTNVILTLLLFFFGGLLAGLGVLLQLYFDTWLKHLTAEAVASTTATKHET
jgi:hypothetical protein